MKDIKGFEGEYAVTSCGRIWSYKSNKFLKLEKASNGYLRIYLKGKHYSVHRLVAQAFIPNPENLPLVNHKDENRGHNWVNNLEWCNASYNNTYGNRINKVIEKKSKKVKQLTMDGKLIKIWSSAAEASRELKIHHVYSAANGSRKTAGGYKWEYVGG